MLKKIIICLLFIITISSLSIAYTVDDTPLPRFQSQSISIEQIITPSGEDIYTIKNGEWFNFSSTLANLVEEANIDDRYYARIDEQWKDITDMFYVDSPMNGGVYARVDGEWTNITEFLFGDSDIDGLTYARKDGAWADISKYLFDDAPVDGLSYARKDGIWIDVSNLIPDSFPTKSSLIVSIKGVLVCDINVPQRPLKFQIDCATDESFNNFVFRVDSSINQIGWQFWDGDEFLNMDDTGLLSPSHQDIDYGLITYTYIDAVRNTPYYIRYRSGFEYSWSDYVVEKREL